MKQGCYISRFGDYLINAAKSFQRVGGQIKHAEQELKDMNRLGVVSIWEMGSLGKTNAKEVHLNDVSMKKKVRSSAEDATCRNDGQSPKKGFHQDDPLSPLLFILCFESFSRLILKEEEQGRLHGIKIARNAPAVSQLMYADDLLIMCHTDPQEAAMVNECFKDMGPKAIYIGNSLVFGRNKTKEFHNLKERIKNRLEGWNKHLLSKSGKATLIKSIIQAMPTYSMANFQLPTYRYEELNGLVCKFWWETNPNATGSLALKAWKDICKPKELGDLGFRKLKDMNLAMLAKLGTCFRIGDGSSIYLWKNPWLLGLLNKCLVAKEDLVNPLWRKVYENWEVSKRSWKTKENRKLCDVESAKAILNLE
ncbi:hypothetical protein FEM48_Zijuj06G0137000 [Ziziphus jujuba var. spinosa]|uniref:Reverse transcriptase domain-containing protein n=1 Tax=Ziziphus jujuba var. spinosa TaxID=714518 RepID=A0A978V9L9_ZIZJJ|nr:hypothetical protein FEM48_Zijuj06G0137000 [Ziziphus jujuba var. spinosa]